MVETDFVPDLRPVDDCAHEVLPTFSPDGAIMLLPNAVPNQNPECDKIYFPHFRWGNYVPAFLPTIVLNTASILNLNRDKYPFHFSFHAVYWILNTSTICFRTVSLPSALCPLLRFQTGRNKKRPAEAERFLYSIRREGYSFFPAFNSFFKVSSSSILPSAASCACSAQVSGSCIL